MASGAILLTERRDWPERLVFAAGFGIPLVAGVAARLLLHYDAADLTLSGSFLAGLIAGPYAGALVGAAVGIPPLFAGECGALPFAVGCGFAGGGLREICPKEEIWRFTPFFVTQARINRPGGSCGSFTLDWQVILVTAPILLELLRQTIDSRFPTRIFLLAADERLAATCSCCSRRCSASRSRSRSGTARASSIGWPSRSSC